MGLKCGIIGLPNVGKSTIFNLLTKASIKAENYPFCTIEPNIGIVPIPDPRLNQIAKIVKPKKTLPTTIEFVDIAGLVKDAYKGNGLGNQFLRHIRETEVICHVVRCFDNDQIIHVNGTINPLADINTINIELALADLTVCKRAIDNIQKKNKFNNKEEKIKLEVLIRCLPHLEDAKMLRSLLLNQEEQDAISYLGFLTLKPTIYIANISKNNSKNDSYLTALSSFTNKDESIFIKICADIKNDIDILNKNDRVIFMNKFDIEDQGINQLILASYRLLNLQTYFTVGMKEVRAWTIPIGSIALQAAKKIHTDFGKGFIRAQTISFADFIYYKGTQAAKAAGKMRYEGKNYIVQDGDIMNFLFNV